MTSWNPPPDSGEDPYGQSAQGGPQYGQPQYPQYPQAQYGQPGYPPPPPSYGGGGGGTNGLCIAGFVLAFLCSILGLILSIVGLNQAKSRNQGGQGLAIAGIVISVIGILGGIAYWALVATSVIHRT